MIARQPILDANLKVIAYELLFRSNSNEYHDGTKATMSVIHSVLSGFDYKAVFGNKKLFINFTEDIIKEHYYKILPKGKVVVEILEDIPISNSLIMQCREMKSEGYLLALDDVEDIERCNKMKGIVDIVKLEIPRISKEKLPEIIKQLKEDFVTLAEKVETQDEYKALKDMGVDYFQGFFINDQQH